MKRFVIVSMMLLLVASMAFTQAKPGGIARQAAMGGSQAGAGLVLNPFIMDDPALMLVNPAYQVMYKDYSWMNISGGTLTGLTTGNNGYFGGQNAAISFGLTDALNIGAIFSYDPSAVNLVSGLIAGTGPIPSLAQRATQTIPAVSNVWEAVASYHVNSMDLGFGLTYGWSNKDSKTSTTTPTVTSSETEASARMFGFRAGLNFNLDEGTSFDASAAFRLDKATDKKTSSPVVTANSGEYSASGTELQFVARGKFKMSNKFNFVPYGQFGMLSAEPKEDTPPNGSTATTRSIKVTALTYALGVGGEYHTKNIYLAGGLSWQNAQLKGEVTDPAPVGTTTTTAKYSALPVVNLGGEWWFTEWLAGRAGYYRSIGSVSMKTETTAGTSESNSTATLPFIPMPGVHSNVIVGGLNPGTWDGLVTLGLGFRFGGWALDATVSEEALRRGLGIIGAQDNINTFGYMTASYNFAE